MKPYIRWTKPREEHELMCVNCGGTRKTLHLPKLEVDPVTRTFLPLLLISLKMYNMSHPTPMKGVDIKGNPWYNVYIR